MDLLERETELRILTDALHLAEGGSGSVVLVSGEPGIGKTALVAAFEAAVSDRARVLHGACDDLVTPRSFGPFHDLVRGSDGPLARAFAAGGTRDDVLVAIQRELSNPLRATLAVLEDVHWSDEATLDAIRFLARRIVTERCVLVATYRDDLPVEHLLRAVVGGLTGPSVHRVPLHGLSLQAVRQLASSGGPAAEDLLEVTGGNPFFVQEVVAAPEAGIPATVRDAVVARLRDLPPATRGALELLAVVPGAVDSTLVAELLGPDVALLDDPERRGSSTMLWGRVMPRRSPSTRHERRARRAGPAATSRRARTTPRRWRSGTT